MIKNDLEHGAATFDDQYKTNWQHATQSTPLTVRTPVNDTQVDAGGEGSCDQDMMARELRHLKPEGDW